MLSSVWHFWEAGVTAIQPHPCAHQHHFLIQLSELCVNLPLTHSVSWHGFLLLVCLPVFHSRSYVCSSAASQHGGLYPRCVHGSIMSFIVFACLSVSADRLAPCLFCPQVHLSSACCFLSWEICRYLYCSFYRWRILLNTLPRTHWH